MNPWSCPRCGRQNPHSLDRCLANCGGQKPHVAKIRRPQSRQACIEKLTRTSEVYQAVLASRIATMAPLRPPKVRVSND